MSPANQRTNPEQAQDPPTAKPQTMQQETKRHVLTVYTTHPEKTAVTNKTTLKNNSPPNEFLRDENKPLGGCK